MLIVGPIIRVTYREKKNIYTKTITITKTRPNKMAERANSHLAH